MKLIIFLYKGFRQVKAVVFCKITSYITRMKFSLNGIVYKSNLSSSGIPIIHISRKGKCYVGNNFALGNWSQISASGFDAKCKIEVRNNAFLNIGNNVGITAVTIMCHNHIMIGDNVMIGVGTHIYDTNFHNINPYLRIDKHDPIEQVKTAPIVIKDNVFIGAYSIILKGVTIGKNSIVAAGSVVINSIPDNKIWGGNPAKFIKKI